MSDLSESTLDDEAQQARLTALGERIKAPHEGVARRHRSEEGSRPERGPPSHLDESGPRAHERNDQARGADPAHQHGRLGRLSAESRRSSRLTTITDQIGALLGIAMVGVAFRLFRRDLAHRQQADDATRRLAAIVESSDDAIISKA